jgi:nucleoside-diphosphate-sugar epimerase
LFDPEFMPNITDFLREKTLFVTGTTGFVGKGVIVQILRHAPDVRRIYLPTRPRTLSSGTVVSVEERFRKEVVDSSVFDGLREKWGDAFEDRIQAKLHAVEWKGLTYANLGMDPAVISKLQDEVEVVISSAATVVFDEPIDLALEQNTLGAGRVLDFAKGCRDAVFVHLSTAYVNGQMTGSIPERAFEPNETIAKRMSDGRAPRYDLDEEIEAIQALGRSVRQDAESSERRAVFERVLELQNRGKRVTEHRLAHQLDALKQRWIWKQLVEEGFLRGQRHGWHDSYTMTKAMGEQLIVRERGDLPTAIVRPSIIESSLRDPEPGWLDGLKVADPLIAHFSKGRLSDFPADPNVVLDVIPVDVVANATLSILPHLHEEKEVKIYHVATGSRNPIRLGVMFDYVYEYYRDNPEVDREGRAISVRRWRFPSQGAFRRGLKVRYQLPLAFGRWVLKHLPASHRTSRWSRRLTRIEATIERVLSLSQIYGPYTTLNCLFETGNIQHIYDELGDDDKDRFNTDVSRIDWREYIQEIHIPGLRRHVLKYGDPELEPTQPQA